MNVFEQLYRSELNFSVSSFWDAGYTVKLGDELNGFVAEANVDTWEEVEAWLQDTTISHYPDSDFVAMCFGEK